MSVEGVQTIWQAVGPSEWPPAPVWMSYSTLTELESCPRRWALKSAEYRDIWKGRGYPHVPHTSVLIGQVVHSAIERVARALAEERCDSLESEGAVQVLRRLGGYTVIVTDCMDTVFGRYEGNPRAVPVIESLRHALSMRVPELRSRVQRQVSRIQLAGDGCGMRRGGSNNGDVSVRRPLGEGSHAELEVQVPELGWHGVIDLLTLSDAACEIRDFKTGGIKEEHTLQLQLYALLWSRDRDFNPTGRLVDSLVLSYDEEDLHVEAPNNDALKVLEKEIKERTQKVLYDAGTSAPDARPSREQCQYCSVRHLCDDYWEWLKYDDGYDESASSQFDDVEIELIGEHGPKSWDGRLLSGSEIERGREIILRTATLPVDLHPGQRIRVLNVRVSYDATNGALVPVVATMVSTSEVFVL